MSNTNCDRRFQIRSNFTNTDAHMFNASQIKQNSAKKRLKLCKNGDMLFRNDGLKHIHSIARTKHCCTFIVICPNSDF